MDPSDPERDTLHAQIVKKADPMSHIVVKLTAAALLAGFVAACATPVAAPAPAPVAAPVVTKG